MKLLLAILILSLQACTIYKVRSTMPTPDGDKTIEVSVYSGRSFEAPQLHYGRTAETATFDFGAEKVSDNNAALVSGLLGALLSGRLVVQDPE